jgi:hypothetical protein
MEHLMGIFSTLVLWPMLWAYRPLLEPIMIDRYWLVLLLPLVVAIAVVYKTIKIDNLKQLPRQAALLAAQIIVFMILAAIALWLITELL